MLSKGPWVIYGHYLTVRLWSKQFSYSEIFPQNVVAWIRIRRLFGGFYKRSILQEICSLVEKVVKIDLQIESGIRGQFAHFAVQVNLVEPLISKIRITKKLHRVEYESLPSICLICGCYGHLREVCSYDTGGQGVGARVKGGREETRSKVIKADSKVVEKVENEKYEEWMVIDRRQRRQKRQGNLPPRLKYGNNR